MTGLQDSVHASDAMKNKGFKCSQGYNPVIVEKLDLGVHYIASSVRLPLCNKCWGILLFFSLL